jgi:hypothetical protein
MTRTRDRLQTAAWVLLLCIGAFLALGSIYDLLTAARGQLPSDHVASFTAVTGSSWQDASTAPYITRVEADYAIYELLFAAIFLVVAAIPLRRRERWAWWTCWLILVPELAFAIVFGANAPTNVMLGIALAIIAALALIGIRFSIG